MRIVHVEDFFHPRAGYQVNILAKFMQAMGNEVFIITSEMELIPEYLTSFFGRDDIEKYDKKYTQDTGVRIIRIPLKKYISGRAVYDKSIFSIVDGLKPDVLYVHGNDTLIAIQYFMRLKKLSYPVISDSHMLEMASVNKFSKIFRTAYKHTIAKIVKKNRISIIRTQDDKYVEKCLGIPLEQCPWISTGTDTLLFHKSTAIKKQFLCENGLSPLDKVVVYAGKLDEAKGGKILAEAIREQIVLDNGGKVLFVIVGNCVGEYGAEVEKLFDISANMIRRYPTQAYTELPYFYQIADIAVFPRQCSLSFYDAQACGLPVIAENNNINEERLGHQNGRSFAEGNVVEFRKTILDLCNEDIQQYEVMSQHSIEFVKQNYDYKTIAQKYYDILKDVVDIYANLKKTERR